MPNRLASETSPYLRQHADNPVDWYPWGDEAFDEARRRGVPVLLSVGYSACHWCHVMAHESFEDESTASVVNRLFVAVKVDREERPDVDAVYMEAVQAMTGSGGWPMTVFLAPDGRPFYGGTYFPPEPRHGMPSFRQVLEAVDDVWRTRPEEVEQQAAGLVDAVRSRTTVGSDASTELSPSMLDGAYRVLRANHDDEWGGFGRAPKFPQPAMLELLLRAYAHNRAPETMAVLETSLDAMASGGMYDHLGGGFARYSVDAFWMVPHFEKMLYDQAGLARVYLHAWQVSGHERWRQVLEETIGYVLRDLRSPAGGLCSAEDADSEGEEGKFYVWQLDELMSVVGGDASVAEWYGVTKSGNFEGANILHRPVRGDLLRPPSVEEARAALFEARSKRVRPGLDDKVLTEWNAMFLSALAEAAGATGRDDWLSAAVELGEFLLSSLRRADGRWMRSWQASGGARVLAYAADYAWLVDAFVRLGEATGEARWIASARDVADDMLRLFWDPDVGGLFTTGEDAERLIVRSKDLLDGATPAANSVAAVALLRLSALTGEQRYADRAEAILRLVAEPLATHPAALTWALGAVDMLVTGTTEIAVVGDRPDLVDAVRSRYLPTAVLAWGEPYDGPLWAERSEGRAYVCRNYACQSPVTSAEDLLSQLG
ncbi:MAG: uncharacterized protein QOE35_1043 [Actinomycetota bacterium]|jgi:uncharacterized protein YyaL (SSP411 family)